MADVIKARVLVLAHFWSAFVLFAVALLLGEWQMVLRSPLHAWFDIPEHYYRTVTGHGTVLAPSTDNGRSTAYGSWLESCVHKLQKFQSPAVSEHCHRPTNAHVCTVSHQDSDPTFAARRPLKNALGIASVTGGAYRWHSRGQEAQHVRIIGVGHVLFAVAAASLAALSVTFGDFAPMWQAIPAALPGRALWIYGAAIALLASSAGLFVPRTAGVSLVLIGAYQIAWAAASMPPILSKPLVGSSWYGLCEATTALMGSFILYVRLKRQPRGDGPFAESTLLRGIQAVFGLTCVYYGWSHFAFAAYTASLVPTWLPGHLDFAYLTGAAHCAAGIGIAVGILPRLAATLEACMMISFGLLVWVPSLLAEPRPPWAGSPQNQWSELVVNFVLAASAWLVADSLRHHRLTPRVA